VRLVPEERRANKAATGQIGWNLDGAAVKEPQNQYTGKGDEHGKEEAEIP
jgi:hypothetical protein